LRDLLPRLRLAAQGAPDDGGLLLPGHAEVHVFARLRDGGRNLRQALVLLFGDTRVRGDDHVWVEGHDGLEVQFTKRHGQHFGLRVAQLVLRPGPGGVGLVAEPVAHRDRLHPQRQDGVLLTVAQRNHPLGRGWNDRRAEFVLDGDREHRRLRRAGVRRRGTTQGGLQPGQDPIHGIGQAQHRIEVQRIVQRIAGVKEQIAPRFGDRKLLVQRVLLERLLFFRCEGEPDQHVLIHQVETLAAERGVKGLPRQRIDLFWDAEPQRGDEPSARVLGAVGVEALGEAVGRGYHRDGILELRVLLARGAELCLHLRHQRLGLAFAPQGAAQGQRLRLPGNAPIHIFPWLGDGRRDLRQFVVFLLGQGRVQPHDQVRLQLGDLFEIQLITEHLGQRGPGELSLGPGEDGPRSLPIPFARRDWHNPQRQQSVLIGQPHRNHPFRRLLERGAAVFMFDTDRKSRGHRHAQGLLSRRGHGGCRGRTGRQQHGNRQNHETRGAGERQKAMKTHSDEPFYSWYVEVWRSIRLSIAITTKYI